MANVKFYIDKRTRQSARTNIYLVCRYEYKTFYYCPKLYIPPEDWDATKQRVKSRHKQAKAFNTILDVLEDKLHEIESNFFVKAVLNGEARPDIQVFKKAFLDAIEPHKSSPPPPKPKPRKKKAKPPKIVTLVHLFNRFIKEKKNTHTEGTLRVFRRSKSNLENFAEKRGHSLDVQLIDEKFQRKYMDYLIEELQYANNTIKTDIRKLHAVMNHFIDEHNNHKYKKFKAPSSETKRFICTYDEIMKLYKYEPSEPMLLRLRDCAVFSFFTGLSYTDLCNLQVSNLIEDNLNGEKITIVDFKRQKTKRYNQIPLNKVCMEILERWKGKQDSGQLLPVYGSDMVMNRYLHALLQESGLFDREVQKVKESGKRRIVTKLPRWQAITFHSFRHGYASYLANQNTNPLTIQKLMGHSKLETTMIYIQQNRKQVFAEALDKLEK